MTDVLDYGEPDAASHGAMDYDGDDDMHQPSGSRFENERDAGHNGADVDMATGANGSSLHAAQRASPDHTRRRDKGPHMYQFPKELAVEAASNRGPSPLPENYDSSPAGPSEVEIPPAVPDLIGGPKDIRLAALHLTGQPISKLSTSRVFAYVSHFGAQPLGVEWIDDCSINVVFPDAAAARLALEYLCPAVSMGDAPIVPLPTVEEIRQAAEQQKQYSQSAGAQDEMNWSHTFVELLLLQRRCHRFPQRLFTGVEKDAQSKAEELVALTNRPSEYPDDAPEIYRELEEEDRINYLHREWQGKIKDVKTLQGTIWARYAIESADIKPKKAKLYSNWYKEHGDDAGKQVVPKLLEVGAEAEKRELLPAQDQSAQAGPSNDQWGPIRFGGKTSNEARGRGAGRGQAVMDSLDDTLSNLRDIQSSSGVEDRGLRRSASPVQRRGRNGRAYDTTTLDDEMDSYNAARAPERTSASPPMSRTTAWGPLQQRHAQFGGAAGSTASAAAPSFSRNGPGGRQAHHDRTNRYGDDVMMDVSGGGDGSGYNSSAGGGGAEDANGSGIKIKGRGRRKAPEPSSGSGRGSSGMHGWNDDTNGHSRHGNHERELFGPPSSSSRRGRGANRHRNGNNSSSTSGGEIDESADIFERAGIVRNNAYGRRQQMEMDAVPPAALEHVGRANILRKGGHGAGGFASGSANIPASTTLASRLAAASNGNGNGHVATDASGMSLVDRIQTESNEGAWDA